MSGRVPCPTCGELAPAGVARCPKDGAALPVPFHEADVQDPLVGQTLGEYQVEERIGGGGMGIVYRAVQPVIGKTVAIKVLRPEIAAEPEQMKRLLAEARAVNAIRHRGIVDVFSFGKLPDGRQYLVMEYLEGKPLDRVIAEEAPMPAEEVVELLADVLDALAAAHVAGVVHRDLKPNNIFVVRPASGSRYVKLFDFGLAMVRTPHSTSAEGVSVLIGTPEYMAPEQALGEPVGPSTDLYAVGVIAFEMLTGKLPLVADSVFDTIHAQVNTPAPRASAVLVGVPQAVDDLIDQLLKKRPSDRPESASSVRRHLLRIQNSLHSEATRQIPLTGALPKVRHTPAPMSTVADPLSDTQLTEFDGEPDGWLKAARRRPALLGASLGAAVLLGLGLGALSWDRSDPQAPSGVSPMRAPAVQGGELAPEPRWRAETLAKLSHLESELRRTAPKGTAPSPAALKGLAETRQRVMEAQTARDRKNVENAVSELERRFR